MTTTNGADAERPPSLRRLDSPSASALADLAGTFEDLQMVLRCCERLVEALAATDGEPDDLLVEAVWTTALLSYARGFSAGSGDQRLTEDDLTASQAHGDALEWHRVLLRLRDHYADPVANPRERFSVAAAQDEDGAAQGIAITSARQPLVDDLTVRQTGAIAYALSALVNDRITERQQALSGELTSMSKAELAALPEVDVAPPESNG